METPLCRQLLDKALEPLASNAELRTRILEIRRAVDIIYDTEQRRSAPRSGPVASAAEATSVLTSWREYLADNRDDIADWYAAYARRTASPREVFAQLRRSPERRIARPPRRWTHDVLWQAYETAGLTDGAEDVRHGVQTWPRSSGSSSAQSPPAPLRLDHRRTLPQLACQAGTSGGTIHR